MQRRQFLKFLTGPACLGPIACSLSGCGTLIHNDRIGQPHTNQIDWKIAALDGLGMLFFFVPGVVAFVVDFYTGAIYIPYDEYAVPYQMPSSGPQSPPANGSAPASGVPVPSLPAPPADVTTLPPLETNSQASSMANPELGLRQIQIPREQLHPQALEQIVSAQIGQQVILEEQQARLSVLPQLDSFHDQRERHDADRQFGFTVGSFFDRIRNA